MFGLGFQEVIVIAILALLLLGPKKLPELMSQLGKFMRDFQNAADDVKRELTRPTEEMKAPLQAAREAVEKTLSVYDPVKNPEHAKVAQEIAGQASAEQLSPSDRAAVEITAENTKPITVEPPAPTTGGTAPEPVGPDKPPGLAG